MTKLICGLCYFLYRSYLGRFILPPPIPHHPTPHLFNSHFLPLFPSQLTNHLFRQSHTKRSLPHSRNLPHISEYFNLNPFIFYNLTYFMTTSNHNISIRRFWVITRGNIIFSNDTRWIILITERMTRNPHRIFI